MARTVCIELSQGRRAAPALNRGTVFLPSPSPLRDFRDCFTSGYDRIAAVCRRIEEPGIAVASFDEKSGDLAGLLRVMSRVDRHSAAVIGRHDKADLFLEGDEALALRQMLVIVDPVRSWEPGAETGFRVLDLRTEGGFADERGQVLRGIRAEGPALLRCPGFALMFLPLGDPSNWPESADEAWAFLPERIYLDERATRLVASPWPRGSRPFMRTSAIVQTRGPRLVDSARGPAEEVVGRLLIVGPHRRHEIPLSADALAEGVLIGRYDRCNGHELFQDESVSRVHLLLTSIEGRVIAVDTGSTFGTRRGSGPVFRSVELADGDELHIGHVTSVRWTVG